MKTYTITEKQDINSYREPVEILAKNLTAAKRVASKNQAFFGTVLEISDFHGVVSIKEDGKWEDK